MHADADPDPSARDRAFERLYRRHARDVYRYTLAVLRNPADAEDITQTTFLNAYRAFKRGEEPLKPQNWLIKIAHNACRTRYIRASRRPQEVPLEESLHELAIAPDELPDVVAVLEALGRLPFNQRAALVLRELEGRSYKEIAEALDVSVPAVETLIFRARRSLRIERSALRTLGALPLPGSLSTVSGGGAVVGGGAAAGTGVVLKTLAAVGIGVVAAGAGKAVQEAALGWAGTAPAAVVEHAAATPGVGATVGLPGRSAGRGAWVVTRGRGAGIPRGAPERDASPGSGQTPAGPSAPAPSAPGGGATPGSSEPGAGAAPASTEDKTAVGTAVGTVAETVETVVETVSKVVPPVPAPSPPRVPDVPVPPVPPVEPPSLPPPPPLPPLPDLPVLP